MKSPVTSSPGSTMTRPAIAIGKIGVLLYFLSACGMPSGDGVSEPRSALFRELCPISDTIHLEETSGDSIGGIGSFVETFDGGFLLGDRILPRIRRYSWDGSFQAAFGQFGSGPGEFRSIGGVAENEGKRTVVVDPTLGRVTLLSEELTLHSTLDIRPRPRGLVFPMGESMVLSDAPGSRKTGFSLRGPDFEEISTFVLPNQSTLGEKPYWGSISSTLGTVAGEEFFGAISLFYPIYSFDRAGSPSGTIGHPPPSFRESKGVEPGVFTGPGAGARLEDWLGSFTIIAGLSTVLDSLLVVTHGRLSRSSTAHFVTRQYAVDLYDARSHKKLLEDVRLPDGTRVLGGGSFLYLLSAEPPNPWTIVRCHLNFPAL